jgi:hypothetical protein
MQISSTAVANSSTAIKNATALSAAGQAKPFSRSEVRGNGVSASASAAVDRNPTGLPRQITGDIDLAIDVASDRLQPGSTMDVTIAGTPMVLHRLQSGIGVFLQSPADHAASRSNGLMLHRTPGERAGMTLDGQAIDSIRHPSFGQAHITLMRLQRALGLSSNIVV